MPKGRVSFITSETVGPLFQVLEKFLVFVTRPSARRSFLTASKIKGKVQIKLIKLQNQPNPTPIIWRNISKLKAKLFSLQRKTSVFKPFFRRPRFRSKVRLGGQGFYRNRTKVVLGGVGRLTKKIISLPLVRSLRIRTSKLKKRRLRWWGSVTGKRAYRKLELVKQLRRRRLLFLSSRRFSQRAGVQQYMERIRSLQARQTMLRNRRYIRLLAISSKRAMLEEGCLVGGLTKRAGESGKVSFQGYKYLRSLSRISSVPFRPITWTKPFFRKQRRKVVRRMQFSQTQKTGGFGRWGVGSSRHRAKVRNRYCDKLVRYYRKWWTARHVRLGRFGCHLHSYVLYLKGFDPKFFHHVFTYVLKKFMRTLAQHSVRIRNRWFRFLLKLFLYRMLMKTMPDSSLLGGGLVSNSRFFDGPPLFPDRGVVDGIKKQQNDG